MTRKLLGVTLLTLLTSGCSSLFNIGSDDYACKGMPNTVTCMSAKDVFAATEGDEYKTALKREQEGAAAAAGGKVEGEGGTRVLIAEGADNAPLPMRARNPLPIRSQAVVMRIAVDPWEDERGDLYVPGFIYTEVEARRWEIGARNPRVAPTLRPLSVVEQGSGEKTKP